jgi:hypothetical protein
MKKKSSNPLATLGCLGLMSVVLFGGGVKLMSDKPIIRLRPELEKLYGVRGFRCSLRLNEGRLDVEPPAALVLDRYEQRRLGGEALRRYLVLTKGRTQVAAVQILPLPGEVVTLDQAAFEAAFGAPEIESAAAASGARLVAPARVAPGLRGLLIVAELDGDDAALKRAAAALLRLNNVCFVQVRRGGRVAVEAGVDAPSLRSGVAPVASPASVAPVGSPR